MADLPMDDVELSVPVVSRGITQVSLSPPNPAKPDNRLVLGYPNSGQGTGSNFLTRIEFGFVLGKVFGQLSPTLNRIVFFFKLIIFNKENKQRPMTAVAIQCLYQVRLGTYGLQATSTCLLIFQLPGRRLAERRLPTIATQAAGREILLVSLIL